ncbi:MAG TPA: T9SS type A sorting domain-containing protein [Chitinophagaceae bacterium]
MKNKSKFDSLRKLITILSFILLIAIHSQGQGSRNTPSTDPGITLNTYPNPATTYITFDLQKGFEKGLSIQVFSFLGRKMYESQSLTEKTTIDLSEYNRGVYIFQLKDQTGRIIKSGKFQVSK